MTMTFNCNEGLGDKLFVCFDDPNSLLFRISQPEQDEIFDGAVFLSNDDVQLLAMVLLEYVKIQKQKIEKQKKKAEDAALMEEIF